MGFETVAQGKMFDGKNRGKKSRGTVPLSIFSKFVAPKLFFKLVVFVCFCLGAELGGGRDGGYSLL